MTYWKRRLLGRFVLMLLNFATSMSIKNKATVNVSWVCLLYSFIILVVMTSIVQGAYLHIGVRLSRCSFRLTGQCEGLEA